MMMKRYILALGSNHQAAKHLPEACRLLQDTLPGIRFSETLQTVSLGKCGNDFLNCLGYGTTSLSLSIVRNRLKEIETLCGNSLILRDSGKVAMDIDLLYWFNRRYHKNDWNRDYIIRLLQSIETDHEKYNI